MITLTHAMGEIFYFPHEGDVFPTNLEETIGEHNDIYGSDYQSCTIIYGETDAINAYVEVMKKQAEKANYGMDIFITTVASVIHGKTFIYSNWDFNDFGDLDVPKGLQYIFAGAQADDMSMHEYVDFFIIKNAFTKSLKIPGEELTEYYNELKDGIAEYQWDHLYITHLKNEDTLTFMRDYLKTMYQFYPTREGEELKKQLKIIERGIEIREVSEMKLTEAKLHYKHGKSDKQYNLKFNDSRGIGKCWVDTYYGKKAENHIETPYVTYEVGVEHITKTVVKQMKKGYTLISYSC